MTSPLRSALEFVPLERKRRELARVADWKTQAAVAVKPILGEYLLAKSLSGGEDDLEPARFYDCLDWILSSRATATGLERLLRLHAILTGDGEVDYRSSPAAPLGPGHVPLDYEMVPRALDRLFQWMQSPAFGEMHAIEQGVVCQLRLYEIWPFEARSEMTADAFSYSVLYGRIGLLPWLMPSDLVDFRAALYQAFGFVTKPLVDFNIKACVRTCEEVLRQLSR